MPNSDARNSDNLCPSVYSVFHTYHLLILAFSNPSHAMQHDML